jgi:hypothetical protein
MHISFKIIKFYFTLIRSTCFGHHCVHHQELLIAANAVSGYRVVLVRLFPPALFCCYSRTRACNFFWICFILTNTQLIYVVTLLLFNYYLIICFKSYLCSIGKKKLHADTGTRTNIVCFRRVVPSRINVLGYLWVRQTTTLSQHTSLVRKLASRTSRKINYL